MNNLGSYAVDRERASVDSLLPALERQEMPAIIYGTAWKKEQTTDYVLQAYRAGFRGFDTACQPRHYDEAGLGEALKILAAEGVQRREYYLQSKFSPPSAQDMATMPYAADAGIAEQVLQSFAVSLQNLNADYLDTLILHSPLANPRLTLTAWRAMEQIFREGGACRLGISNYYELDLLKKLYSEATIKPQVLQNRFYPSSGYDVELRQWCREHHITYQSFWTLTANPHLLRHSLVQFLARKYSRSRPQILFAYLQQRGVVPLTGTRSQQHMQEDLASTHCRLSHAELLQMDSLILQAIPGK